MGRARGPRGFSGPVVKAKDPIGAIKRIWRYMERQKVALIASIIFVIITTLLGLLAPYLIGVIVDDYIIPKDISGTLRFASILAIIYLATTVFTWLQNFMMVRVSLETIRKMRQDLFDKFQTLSLSFFDKRQHGDLMSRVTNDIDQLNNALSQSVIQIFSSVLMVTGVGIAMFSMNWVLAIVTLLVIPLMIFTTKKLVSYSSSYFIKRQTDLGELNGFIEESISGNEVITLFGKEEKIDRQFSEVNERLRHSAMAADTVSGFLGPVNNFINNLGLGFVIAIGAVMTVNELATVGIIAAFVTYSRQFFRPINQLSNLLNTFQSAIAGAERVFEVMDETPDLVDREEAVNVDRFVGNVEFSHVHFYYDAGKPILKDIDFQVQAGEKIALVGPTGSGKTTIINLLMRFYDVTEGQLKVDGKDIRDYSLSALRKRVGVVLQDTFLFSGSIMENIRYGRLEATDEDVFAAAKMASAHHFIKHLPNGYHTKITSGGSNLSQGQRQLLAIARAILADSDILILDEATSSIDTNTEIEIQKGINRLTEGRTSFVIAHRLKTIENADRILVIHQGKIIESGTHQELLHNKGFYYDMYESQFNRGLSPHALKY
ncbi:multidrug ABC transporter ATP-binding protein [Lederbergia galactosidilytica]|uniref:Multidrug ABC transporter ATP-binding protein n=2 Tax=Lederbergia galactosidilytica TaxID=217031 RepID=A0A178A6Y1_9BACI|nr:ABC transporter ATP-binding protein [Lederbergia galactosidilytica]OAK75589.1 multidrug ABC transporter ATP-binding protein [Lederbergia galactosidilytica]